jgi:hypothetical protein
MNLGQSDPPLDWFKGKFTGKPHIKWENLWFPVFFPLNQSIESTIFLVHTPIFLDKNGITMDQSFEFLQLADLLLPGASI